MKYLCLVYVEEKKLNALSKAELDALIAEALAYDDELRKSGHYLVSDALQPVQTATTLRMRNGKVSITDGPFAETKEVVGGYWMIQVKSKEEAVEWASRCPASDNEVIEIRQVQELSDFPADVQEAAAGFAELQAQSAQNRRS